MEARWSRGWCTDFLYLLGLKLLGLDAVRLRCPPSQVAIHAGFMACFPLAIRHGEAHLLSIKVRAGLGNLLVGMLDLFGFLGHYGLDALQDLLFWGRVYWLIKRQKLDTIQTGGTSD